MTPFGPASRSWYRRQILGLKQFFIGRHCTVLLLDDRTSQDGRSPAAESGARRHHARAAGARVRRRAAATAGDQVARRPLSGRVPTTPDHHTRAGPSGLPAARRRRLALSTKPRRREQRHREDRCAARRRARSRHLPRSSSARPARGKSAIATRIAVAAADRGEHVAMYLFDEGLGRFRRRAAGLGSERDDARRERPHRAPQVVPGGDVAR